MSMNYLGVAIWATLAGLWLARLRVQFDLLSLLFFLETFLTAILLAVRRLPVREGSLPQKLLAWGVALAPYLAFESASRGWSGGEMLQAAALACVLAAQVTLGRSFGIAPADRGLVTRGPYRLVRHPMYAGELLALLGYTLSHLSLRNAAALVVLAAVQVVRALWEEQVLDSPEYRKYRKEVRWRLLPFVW